MGVYPGALPAAGAAVPTATLVAAGHTALHNTDRDEIRAIATKLGLVASVPSVGTVLRGTGAGESQWGQVVLSTDVTGVLPQANGGTGTNLATGTGKAVYQDAPTLNTPTLTSPTVTSPTVDSFANAQHDHQDADGGGKLSEAALDWSTFSNNMKSASNSGNITPTNSSQDLASSGLSISFTVAQACNALVTVSLGVQSTTDFEFQPQIRLGGSIVKSFTPAASISNAGGRALVRGFTWVVPLAQGANTLSAGLLLSSSTTPGIAANGGTIAAIVLGEVTA